MCRVGSRGGDVPITRAPNWIYPETINGLTDISPERAIIVDPYTCVLEGARSGIAASALSRSIVLTAQPRADIQTPTRDRPTFITHLHLLPPLHPSVHFTDNSFSQHSRLVCEPTPRPQLPTFAADQMSKAMMSLTPSFGNTVPS